MNRYFKISIVTVLCILLASCVMDTTPVDVWENATYTEDAEIGMGEKIFTLVVEAREKTVTLNIHTDKSILSDALSEHKLISGDEGPYGLYVKVVNGITADYDTTKSYWSLNKNGEYMLTGVDSAEISDGDSYEFIYTDAE